MFFFAITLKLNRRTDFTNDLAKLRKAIRYFFSIGVIPPYKIELQPEGLHNMHVHFMLTKSAFFNFRDAHDEMKKRDINCDIKQLHPDDVDRWLSYCIKYKGDLAFDYAESTGKEYNKINSFLSRIQFENDYVEWLKETQGLSAEAVRPICQHCGEPKDHICGEYKCGNNK